MKILLINSSQNISLWISLKIIKRIFKLRKKSGNKKNINDLSVVCCQNPFTNTKTFLHSHILGNFSQYQGKNSFIDHTHTGVDVCMYSFTQTRQCRCRCRKATAAGVLWIFVMMMMMSFLHTWMLHQANTCSNGIYFFSPRMFCCSSKQWRCCHSNDYDDNDDENDDVELDGLSWRLPLNMALYECQMS